MPIAKCQMEYRGQVSGIALSFIRHLAIGIRQSPLQTTDEN
jgi:hypothetical protein